MRLGYSINSAVPTGRSAADHASDLLDRARIATEAGFDYVQAGDHHVVTGGGYLQNVPTLARLTEVVDHVAPLFLLPLHHPVLLAEYCGTLAALSDTFELWCALGYTESEFEAFDVPLAERVPRFSESIRILEALSQDDPVSFDGEHFSLDGVSVDPAASPERICIGGSVEPAVRRAGRLGDSWVAGPTESVADLETKGKWFDDAGGDTLIVRRDALVLEDNDRAHRAAEELLESGYRGWHVDVEWPLVGDAAAVAGQIEALQEVGADEVVVRPMSENHAAETLRETARACSLS